MKAWFVGLAGLSCGLTMLIGNSASAAPPSRATPSVEARGLTAHVDPRSLRRGDRANQIPAATEDSTARSATGWTTTRIFTPPAGVLEGNTEVSCSSPTTCVAAIYAYEADGDQYRTPVTELFTLTKLRNGKWSSVVNRNADMDSSAAGSGNPSSTPATLVNLSCTKGGFCATVGAQANLTPFTTYAPTNRWNDPLGYGTSGPTSLPLPTGGAVSFFDAAGTSSLDCVSTNDCVLIAWGAASHGSITPTGPNEFRVQGGGTGYFATNDWGATWTPLTGATSDLSPLLGGLSLSCPSAQLCVAVGGDGTVLTSGAPIGKTWSTGKAPAARLESVSCPTTSLCVALGLRNTSLPGAPEYIYASTDPSSPHSWRRIVRVPRPGSESWLDYRPDSIACSSASLCVVTADVNDLQWLATASTNPASPSSWSTPVPILKLRAVAGDNTRTTTLTCPYRTLCVMADDKGNVYTTADPSEILTAASADSR